jgi:hypothetical protein
LSAGDVTALQATSASSAELDLARIPGDDLFCGAASRYDIRFAEQAIQNERDFAAATPVAGFTETAMTGSRGPGHVLFDDGRFAGRQLYFALVTVDDQGNRSALTPLGSAEFPPAPTEAPTPTPTPTPAPTLTPTASPSSPPVTATLSATTADDDVGCQAGGSGGSFGWLLLLPLLLLGSRTRPGKGGHFGA